MRCSSSRWRRLVGETVTRQRRADDVKGVGRIAAMSSRIRQRLDDFLKLDDRPRPSMRHHERDRVGVRRAYVHEMYPEAVDRRLELREAVEARLARAPVILVAPICGDLLRVGERRSLRPVVNALALGPSRLAQPALEVVELRIGRGDSGKVRYCCSSNDLLPNCFSESSALAPWVLSQMHLTSVLSSVGAIVLI